MGIAAHCITVFWKILFMFQKIIAHFVDKISLLAILEILIYLKVTVVFYFMGGQEFYDLHLHNLQVIQGSWNLMHT